MQISTVAFRTLLHSMLGLAVGVLVVGCETPKRPEIVIKSKPSAYDRLVNDAVRARWYGLVERNTVPPVKGTVVIRFKLHADGRVTDLIVAETTVPDSLAVLCEKAIRDAAPFGNWPQEMHAVVGADERDITFTFHYDAQGSRTIRDALRMRRN